MTDAAAQPLPTAPAQPFKPVLPTLSGLPTRGVTPRSDPPRADVVPTNDVSQEDRMAIFERVLDEVGAASPVASAQVSSPTPTPTAPAPVLPTLPVSAPTLPVEATIVPAGGLNVDAPLDTGVLTQALPMAVHQATDPLLNPATPGPATTAKEHQQPALLDQQSVDATADVGGMQVIEQEPAPELSPEVEAYIQTVQDHAAQAPHEVVIADGTQQSATTTYPSRPVVVVPITPQIEKEGRFKSPVFSIKWLIEWSHKIIKMFAGKVIYRETS